MKKQTYIRCPRCELNYILKEDKYCNVCKMEMKAQGTLSDEDNLDLELCPICKVNYIRPDEDMCASCAKEHASDEEDEEGVDTGEKDEDSIWNTYTTIEDDDDDSYVDKDTDDIVPLSGFGDSSLDDDDMEISLGDDEEDSSDDYDGSDEDDDFVSADDFDEDTEDDDDYTNDDEDDEDY